MQWIKYLEEKNIPFNLHILDAHDSLLIEVYRKNTYLFFIATGLITLLQIFTNGEIICQKLLKKDQIFFSSHKTSKSKNNYYYKAQAVIKTIIVSISLENKDLITRLSTENLKILYRSQQYKDTTMVNILSHRNTKKRMIQLLLILAQNLGEYNDYIIYIPFHIPHHTIAMIIGSNRTTVTRIMRYFKDKKIIFYNNQQITIYNILQLMQL